MCQKCSLEVIFTSVLVCTLRSTRITSKHNQYFKKITRKESTEYYEIISGSYYRLDALIDTSTKSKSFFVRAISATTKKNYGRVNINTQIHKSDPITITSYTKKFLKTNSKEKFVLNSFWKQTLKTNLNQKSLWKQILKTNLPKFSLISYLNDFCT